MIDTDFAIRRIVESGVQENHARAIVREIVDAQTELVSKRDLKDAMHEVKAEITELKNAVILLDKMSGLQFKGLYALLFALCIGMVKLVFFP